MTDKYSAVTELAGDMVTQEQINRMCHRYYWAKNYCANKDVVEAGCGTGQGLNYLYAVSNSLAAGDYSGEILNAAKENCTHKIDLQQFDAQKMPYPDNSKDVIILFEALYYIPDATLFVSECQRVLREKGVVLIATANKDLYDFNPSPHSYKYYGVKELGEIFSSHGFDAEIFGYLDTSKITLRQRILRPLKKIIVMLGLMPKTMTGKKILKRLVFGELVRMPKSISPDMIEYSSPTKIEDITVADCKYKVIYCAASLS